jgi:hypothetical protein
MMIYHWEIINEIENFREREKTFLEKKGRKYVIRHEREAS